MNRWWTYQKERFPLAAHGPLIAAFSASAVSFSALLRRGQPVPRSFVVAFVVSLGSFLLLRLADEFKDAEEDARFRPYRPVPRGLVKLRELGWLGCGVALLQLILASSIGLTLAGLLAITWTYFLFMSKEFFARKWLKARPVVYLFSHMMIMPLVDWFATGCDWVHAGKGMPEGLLWFLGASFWNGVVIELGRKIRAPEQEEHGVETYSFLWGRRVAVSSWLAAMAATFAFAAMAAREISFLVPAVTSLALLWLGAASLGLAFLRTMRAKLAKGIESYSGLWSLALYLMLGVVPLCLRK
ncbi:MAG TPA: UbiA family prenyltransferase [Acidobacteriaceae bacterium]|jgi:4-hydroxybenzoate polyprenyltransferase|nr:UbiA family prenyltransferase [Acidobacteriaceae bacterium]